MARKGRPHLKKNDQNKTLRSKDTSKERIARIFNSKGPSKRGGAHSQDGGKVRSNKP